jgi:NADPH-ferrihemoprotein reductase
MDNETARVLVCFSTQSGTSQLLAEKFCNEFNELVGYEICKIERISAINLEQDYSKYDIIIFFISSYGEGEPCDDGIEFFEKLVTFRQAIKYSLFGCGNTYYDDYQAAAIKLKDALDLNNSTMIGLFGQSNEANNAILDDYEEWKFDYIYKLSEFLNVKLNQVSEFKPIYQILEINGKKTNFARPPYHELNPYATKIDLNSVKRYGRDYLHFDIKLDKDKSRLKYQSGDHVGILPCNNVEDVKELVKILKLDENGPIKVIPYNRMSANKWLNQEYGSYIEFLSKHVEINGILSRQFIKDLIRFFIINKDIENKLFELIVSKEVFVQKVINKKLTFVKLFKNMNIQSEDYNSIDISFILENFGPLKPRYFSISSSASIEKGSVGVMIKLVKDDANLFTGVCSQTISGIVNNKKENELKIFTMKSKFRLPFDLTRPLIFIAAGSGLAPFRGFLQEICFSNNKMNQISEISLYFGLRENNENYYIYKTEMEQFQEILGKKFEIKLAVSQSQQQKNYVQDILLQDSASINDQLQHQQGSLYVCGSVIMGQGVRRALISILGEKSKQQGDQQLQKLAALGRYREDVW